MDNDHLEKDTCDAICQQGSPPPIRRDWTRGNLEGWIKVRKEILSNLEEMYIYIYICISEGVEREIQVRGR